MGNILRIFTIFKTNPLLIIDSNKTIEYHHVIFDVEYSNVALLHIMNRKSDKVSKFNSMLYSLIRSFTKKDYYKISISDSDRFMEGNNLIRKFESSNN